MKSCAFHRLLVAGVLGLACFGVPALASTLYPFHTASQMNNFAISAASSGTGAWSDAPGAGGASGLVEVAISGAQTRTYYQATPVIPDAQGLTVSCFFRAAAYETTAVARVAVGLSLDQTSNLSTSNTPVQGRLIKNGTTSGVLEVRNPVPATATNTTGVLLMTGRWYRLSATFIPQPASQSFLVTVRIEDHGMTGGVTQPTLLATARGTRTGLADFFTADGRPKPVYAGLLMQNDGGGATAFDQFEIQVGPPASLAFAGTITSAKPGHFFTPQETLAFSLSLTGPANLSRDVLISLVDVHGVTVASTTVYLPAGTARPVTFPVNFSPVPEGLYRLRATARDECLGETTVGVVPAAPAATPDPAKRFGTIAHLKNLTDADRDIMLDLIARAGFGWVREGFLWHQLQPQAGQWSWARYDDLVDRARSRGISVLPVLCYTAEWASTAPVGTAAVEARQWMPQAAPWANYVAQVVDRYADRVSTWEIWNEPNLASYWKPQPNAADYAALLAASYELIKERQPTAKVISAGLSTQTMDNPTETANHEATFVAAMQAQGTVFDVVGFHPYTVAGHTVTPAQHEARFEATLANLTGALAGPVPLWFTEMGVSTLSRIVSEEAAADYQVIMLTKAAALSSVEKSLVYCFRDTGTDPLEKEHHFGLVNADYTPKPGYFAVRHFIGKLSGMAFHARTQTQGVTLHEFRSGTRRVTVVWADSQPVDVALSLGAASVAVSHVTGAALPANLSAGVLSLRATTSPVFLDYQVN